MKYVKTEPEHESYIDREFSYFPDTGEIWWTRPGSNSRILNKPVGSKMSSGHLCIRICPKGSKVINVLAHRLAWRIYHGTWPERDLDHINGVRHDNRISNLRLATPSENSANCKIYKTNSVGYKGVRKSYNGGYIARVQHNNKRHYLGIFDTAEDAYKAYKSASKTLRGEFHRDE